MDKNSNKSTFIFATVMVVIVGTVLAITAEGLKPFQKENVRKEKMQNINFPSEIFHIKYNYRYPFRNIPEITIVGE